jgi:hypothetical protein
LKRARSGLLVGIISLAAVSVTSAHHSAVASYQAGELISVKGKILSFAWSNPHCHFYVDVTDGPFKGQTYTVELSNPSTLARNGWSKTTLRPGDEVIATVLPSRNGAPIGLCRQCALTINGKRLKKTSGT